MNTIRQFIDSPIYKEYISHFSTTIVMLDDIRPIEFERLNNRLKQRQFLLEGFNCKLKTEEELVEWYEHLIEENKSDILIWIEAFWKYSNDISDEYPDGEFPEGEELAEMDKSTLISIGKSVRSCFALNMIEFEIIKNNPEILTDYYKRIRIPGAAKYAKEMIKLFKKTFAN